MDMREARVELTVRYLGVLFPFRIESLGQVLPHLGFVVGEDIQPRFSARLSVSGTLATKGDLAVQINSERQYWGMIGHDHDHVITEFLAVEELIEDKLAFPSRQKAMFYEIQEQFFLEALPGKSPIAEIQHHFTQLPSLGRLGSLLGKPVANSGFHLVPPNVPPNNADWFEIRIEPDILQPELVYLVHAIFRNTKRDDVLALASRGPHLAEEAIRLIEELP
jgi:hypothetical protein